MLIVLVFLHVNQNSHQMLHLQRKVLHLNHINKWEIL